MYLPDTAEVNRGKEHNPRVRRLCDLCGMLCALCGQKLF
jgi:hypothetical protein